MTVKNMGIDGMIGDLIARLCSLYRAMTANKAEFLRCLSEFDLQELGPKLGASSTSTWLVRALGMSASTAYEYVRVARRMVDFPIMVSAFAQGEIDYSTVRLLLKYLTVDNEEELVELAIQLGHEQLKKLLAGQESTDPKDKGYYLRISETEDGDVEFEGRANAVDGAAFKAALKVGEMAHYDQDDPEKEAEAPEARPAQQTVSGYGMPIGRELLKSLMGIVQIARTRAPSPLRAPAAHVNIVLNGDSHAYMPCSPKAPSKILEQVVANGLTRLNVTDSSGLILNMGRAKRLATDAQINALLTMWGHQCASAGCNHTRFLEIHHMEEWAEGGPTDLENLIPLCSSCHSLVTEGSLKVERHGRQIRFFYADGSAYVSHNHSTVVRDDGLSRHADFEDWKDADSFDDQPI